MLLLANSGYAVKLDHTRIDECARNFSKTNDTQTFNNCLSTAEIYPKKPKECYQSDAALYALKVVFYVSVAFISLYLTASYGAILIKFLSVRFDCGHGCVKLLESSESKSPPTIVTEKSSCFASLWGSKHRQSTPAAINPLQAMTEKTVATLSTIVTGVMTYVSAGWIYSLWQSWTSKDADCQYALDQQ